MSCNDFGCFDLSLTYIGMFMYVSKSVTIHLYNISKVSFPSLSVCSSWLYALIPENTLKF